MEQFDFFRKKEFPKNPGEEKRLRIKRGRDRAKEHAMESVRRFSEAAEKKFERKMPPPKQQNP
ncbi:MAG: hypothetical protein A2934_03325 [Candidatus Sungbacteria bacterium RIFCSPLOWO2_01_FULL_47_10]|uniref:Uncharacterized protein n=1 Tax=Candidatus Sungbacteria bacterium RIFCSPLOWO2_01_FULL_47_10 TaxID=1802276 RepID=A0A1G2L5D7_9BACT|nr:MAG: hypothetical protein A2934_03325 [Candidatus Sungbacteria bacterium RIFCSPLOWO2_01_FULL_47_10]